MQHWVNHVLQNRVHNPSSLADGQAKDLRRIAELIEQVDVYGFRTKELDSIANELAECDCLTQLSKYMWRTATSVGFQNFSIFVLRHGQAGSFKSRMCTSYSEEWVARYRAKNYHFVDPVMARAREHEGTFLFSDLNLGAKKQKDYWRDAVKHKAGSNGVCFSMDRRDGSRIGVTFSTSAAGDKFSELMLLNGSDLRFIALLAADCFCDVAVVAEHLDDILDANELRFLHILASGRDPEVASKVSGRFGSNQALQASIRSKLGVPTIFQAIAVATARGWFDGLPIDEMEVVKPFPPLEGFNLSSFEIADSETMRSV